MLFRSRCIYFPIRPMFWPRIWFCTHILYYSYCNTEHTPAHVICLYTILALCGLGRHMHMHILIIYVPTFLLILQSICPAHFFCVRNFSCTHARGRWCAPCGSSVRWLSSLVKPMQICGPDFLEPIP
jgi:hypothetical protein